MTTPDHIWIAPTHHSNGIDDFYLLDPKFRGNRGTEYVRADIAAEQVQEAYERAAQILDNYGKRYFRADDADIEDLANAIRDLKSDDRNEALSNLVEAAQQLKKTTWMSHPNAADIINRDYWDAFCNALASMEANHD